MLPPGTYGVRVLAAGGDFVDGGFLLQRWVTPATPEAFVEAARKGADVYTPTILEELPAGAWWLIGVEYRPGSFDGFAYTYQIQLEAPLQREQFKDELLKAVAMVVHNAAEMMLPKIGIEPIDILRDAGDRPARLH